MWLGDCKNVLTDLKSMIEKAYAKWKINNVQLSWQ